MLIDIQDIDSSELAVFFERMPAVVHRILLQKMHILVLELEGLVKRKLSGSVLNVVSGALRRSIKNDVKNLKTAIEGMVYSSGDVKYAAIHEFGGKTKAHIIEPKTKKALAFMLGNAKMVLKRVNHPGSVMPERSYMRTSLREMHDRIKQVFGDALKDLG